MRARVVGSMSFSIRLRYSSPRFFQTPLARSIRSLPSAEPAAVPRWSRNSSTGHASFAESVGSGGTGAIGFGPGNVERDAALAQRQTRYVSRRSVPVKQPSYRIGPDYPEFLEDEAGALMPLERERRWSRTYRHPTRRVRHHLSRFMDGSASMSLEELRAGWAAWSSADRIDFCTNARWLRNQSDFTDMLRFIAAEAKPMATSSIALSIATSLPRDEAFGILV